MQRETTPTSQSARRRGTTTPHLVSARTLVRPVVRLAAIYQALGLAGDPFALDPLADTPSTIAMIPPFLAARDELVDWLRSSDTEQASLAVVTGERGAGKTVLLRAVVDQLAGDATIAPRYVTLDDEKVTDGRLLRAIVDAFGQGPATARTGIELIQTVREHVTVSTRNGVLPVLILDGIEMAGSRLEILRTLLTTPVDATAGIDLRIILTGGPELRDRLTRRRSLSHQIGRSISLAPLTREEIVSVVAHRIAAWQQPGIPSRAGFTDEAISIVESWSGGNPAAVIRLAGECLLEAIARGKQEVNATIAHAVERDLTERARQQARIEAAAPYVLPAVQTRLALTLVDDEIEGGTSRTTRRSQQKRSREA